MTKDEFTNKLSEILANKFEKLDYKFGDDCFYLNRDNGMRNLISFDFDGRRSYRVFVGIDYPFDQLVDKNIPPEGARFYRYFTGGSLSSDPRDFTFQTEVQLSKHLERLFNYVMEQILPKFFDTIRTPEEYADSLPEVECIVKYKIYKKELIITKAIEQAKIIINRYKNMQDLGKVREFLETDVYPYIKKNKRHP